MVSESDFYRGRPSPLPSDWFETFRRREPWMSDAEFDGTMPPEFDDYHPYCCNLCKRGVLQGLSDKLQRCSRCRVTRYCCRDHQRRDWKHHKTWCGAFSRAMKHHTEDGVVDYDTWRENSRRAHEKVIYLGGCGLHSAAGQIALCQPRCRRCYRSGRDDGVDLVVCPSCSGVAVCEDCLRGDDDSESPRSWQSFHPGDKEECNLYLVYLCCSGMIVENGDLLVAASDTNCAERFAPTDWHEYFAVKERDFEKSTQLPMNGMLRMAPVKCFLADGLSLPMTVQHVLSELSLLEKRSKLCIHFIGAGSLEFVSLRAFVELARINPQLSRIELVMVGLDWPGAHGGAGAHSFSRCIGSHETPVDCEGIISTYRGLYHDHVGNLQAPDLRVAFNSGIVEPAHYRSWRPTLELMARRREDIPFCITGFNMTEVRDDAERLGALGFRKIVPPSANPFRSLRPFLDPSREESDFVFCNAAYAVLKPN